MAFITTSIVTDLLVFFLTFIFVVILYFKWAYGFWERRGIEFVTPRIPLGCYIRGVSLGVQFSRFYQELKKRGVRHGGFYVFDRPYYMPLDPTIIKDISVKDFNHFTNRNMYYNEKYDPLSAHLLTIEGDHWRQMRTKLTPGFTSGKLKSFFSIFDVTGKSLVSYMDDLIATEKKPIEMMEILYRFTMEFISSCGFGIESNSLRNPDSEFMKYGEEYFNVKLLRHFQIMFGHNFPKLAKFLGVRAIPRHISAFFKSAIEENLAYREQNNVRRKDFLQILIDMKTKPVEQGDADGKPLTVNQIAANSFMFVIAGFETSATTMTFCLFELAANQDIQEKVRQEINAVLPKHNNEITYDALADMAYLNRVVDETLRKHPPVPFIPRFCTKDYKVEGTDLLIPKGTEVLISVLGIHHDEQYYPDPDKFDPERHSEENRASRPPCAYIPFGEGPRNCIGLRLGVLEAKVGMVTLIKNYKFTLHSKTHVPLKIKKEFFVHKIADGLWLNVEKV